MTFKMITMALAREIAGKRDAAKSLDERHYYEMLLDTAVEDIMNINQWYRKAARKRLRRMRAA